MCINRKWIKSLWYIYTMEYYSVIKRNTFESVLMRWMNLDPIIQSEVSQKEKDKISYSNTYIWNLEEWYWRTYLQGSTGETDIENRLIDMGKGEERVRCMERVTWKSAFSQFNSAAQSCPTPCNPVDCSTPGLPVHHQLLEFTQTHVHWVSDAIQPSHPLSSPSPPAPNPS